MCDCYTFPGQRCSLNMFYADRITGMQINPLILSLVNSARYWTQLEKIHLFEGHPLITATYHSTTVAVMNNCFQHCATQFKLMADNSVNTGSFKSRRKLQQMTLLYNCVLVCQLNERCSKNVTWHYVVKFSLKSLVTLTCSLSPSWFTLQL